MSSSRHDHPAPGSVLDRRIRYTLRTLTGIYAAGKVSPWDDWRARLVEYSADEGEARCGGIVFDEHTWDSEVNPDWDAGHWPTRERAIFGKYTYTGPYVTDLGHGQNDFSGTWNNRAEFVYRECLDAIKRSGLIFAWVDDVSAYATFAELGYAKALGKAIWIAGPAEYAELWFVYQMADRTSFGVDDPVRALHTMLTRVETDGVSDE